MNSQIMGTSWKQVSKKYLFAERMLFSLSLVPP